MAVSLGVLVFFGILLLLIFVALLCVGTGGQAIDAVAKLLRLNSDDKTTNNEGRVVATSDNIQLSRREEKVTIEEDQTGKYDVNQSSDGDHSGKDEDQEDYDYPATSSYLKPAKDQVDEHKGTNGGNQNGTDDPSADYSKSVTAHVYQNTKVGKVNPKPAARKPAQVPKPAEAGNDVDVYQNVSIGKS